MKKILLSITFGTFTFGTFGTFGTFWIVGVVGFTLASTNAFAIYRPGWERPIQQARLDVTAAEGRLDRVGSARAVLTKQDGEASPTGVTLYLKMAGQDGVASDMSKPVFLRILEVTRNAQGVVTYMAEQPKEFQGQEEGIFQVRLTSFQSPQWEVQVEWIENENALGRLSLRGHPETVYTTMGLDQ